MIRGIIGVRVLGFQVGSVLVLESALELGLVFW